MILNSDVYLIAGTQSGCGKTTATLALMQHLRASGKTVAPFKSGPDFLDPMWHEKACARTSYNIDTRMVGVALSRQLLASKSQGADITIIEGVMGLFDGLKGVGGVGSSADLAKQLELPVLLVVSAKGMSGSLVALVEGFKARADGMGITIIGVIANHVGSENHAKILRELLVEFNLPPLVAWLDKDAPQLPERHLGLKMPNELDLPNFSDALHVEIDFTTKTTKYTKDIENPLRFSAPETELLRGKTIAIAKDKACCFIYPVNIEWLESQGAEVVYFSPLAGEKVPDADALWLPGGYPELHLNILEQSNTWNSLCDFIESGKPVLAECGGMMLLGQSITDKAGGTAQMANVLPCTFAMQDKLAGLGYRSETSGVTGHEFHHSKREFTAVPARGRLLACGNSSQAQHARVVSLASQLTFRRGGMQSAFEVSRGDAGIRYKNLRASYIHWYFPSNSKEVASWFTQ